MIRDTCWDDFAPGSPIGRRRYLEEEKFVYPGRTNDKSSHPYSYDEFFIFGSREGISRKSVGAVYSDRLFQEDWKKMERLSKEHLGCRFEQAGAEKLGAFLTAWWGKPIRVVALSEGCNAATQYPYWVMWYEHAE
jgi:hypothetical protein